MANSPTQKNQLIDETTHTLRRSFVRFHVVRSCASISSPRISVETSYLLTPHLLAITLLPKQSVSKKRQTVIECHFLTTTRTRARCLLARCSHCSYVSSLCSLPNISGTVHHSDLRFSPLDSSRLGFHSNHLYDALAIRLHRLGSYVWLLPTLAVAEPLEGYR